MLENRHTWAGTSQITMPEAHGSTDLAPFDRHGSCQWVCACPLDGQGASAEHQGRWCQGAQRGSRRR